MIQFFNLETTFNLSSKQKISVWILNTFQKENIAKEIVLSIIFCSDNALLDINKKFLKHDFYTDIITFPIEETETVFEAELYISLDRVEDNAKKYDKLFENELHRVIIHGVLHLCGYHDKSENEQREMRSKEDFYLKVFSKIE